MDKNYRKELENRATAWEHLTLQFPQLKEMPVDKLLEFARSNPGVPVRIIEFKQAADYLSSLPKNAGQESAQKSAHEQSEKEKSHEEHLPHFEAHEKTEEKQPQEQIETLTTQELIAKAQVTSIPETPAPATEQPPLTPTQQPIPSAPQPMPSSSPQATPLAGQGLTATKIRLQNLSATQLRQAPQPLAKRVEADWRFKKVLEEILRTTDFDINGIYLADKSGEEFLNPMLPSSIRMRARKEFERRHPKIAAKYKNQEKEKPVVYPQKFYRTDPVVEELYTSTDKIVKEVTEKLQQQNPALEETSPEVKEGARSQEEAVAKQWVVEHPQKADVYSAFDPMIQKAREEVLRERQGVQKPESPPATLITPIEKPQPTPQTTPPAPAPSPPPTPPTLPKKPVTTETPPPKRPIEEFNEEQKKLANKAPEEKKPPTYHANAHLVMPHGGTTQRPLQKNQETTAPVVTRRTLLPRFVRRVVPGMNNDLLQTPLPNRRRSPFASLPLGGGGFFGGGGRRRRQKATNAFGEIEKVAGTIIGFPLQRAKLAVVIGIAAFFSLIFGFVFTTGNDTGTDLSGKENVNSALQIIPNLTIAKSSSDTSKACIPPAKDTYCIDYPNDAHYTINVTYPDTAGVKTLDNVVVSDTIQADQGSIVEVSPSPASRTSTSVSWNLKDLGQNPPNYTMTLRVHPVQDNSYIINEAVATASNNSSAGGNGCIDQATIDVNKNNATCKYLHPSVEIFDTNISQDAINTYVQKYSSSFVGKKINDGTIGTQAEFEKRVNYIVQKSKEGKINPAIFLAYWKTETAFSTWAGYDMGCTGAPANNFYPQVDCAVGLSSGGFIGTKCALSHEATSPACKGVRDIRTNNASIYSEYPISLPITTFDDLAEVFGSIAPNLNGAGTTNNNCSHTYNELLEVINELHACTSTTAAQGTKTSPDEVLAKYNISVSGLSDASVKIIKQTLSDISGTKLLPLVRNTVIVPALAGEQWSTAEGCDDGKYPTGHIRFYEPLSSLIVAHEFAHVVQKCQRASISLYTTSEYEEAHIKEKGVSDYARNVGAGGGVCPLRKGDRTGMQDLEDYAEMIAYYLNPTTGDDGACGGGTNINPYQQKNSDGSLKYTLHRAVAEKVVGTYP